MAKKTPVKKSKRGLKRSVRRSLSAVLMITAIGVAAIPVPENYAVSEGIQTRAIAADTHTVYGYEELKNKQWKSPEDHGNETDIKDDAIKDLFKEESNSPKILELYDVETGKPATGNKLPTGATALGDSDIKKSLKITDRGSGEELIWEYKYYETISGSKTYVVLCEYNNEYPRGSVDLNTNPRPNIDYFRVSADAFRDYFEGTRETSKLQIKVSDTLTLTMSSDPVTESVKYSYDDYLNDIDMRDRKDWDFFQDYASQTFESQTRIFSEYEGRVNAWLEKEENAGKTWKDYAKDVEAKPDAYTRSKAAAIGDDLENRMNYFRDYCTTLKQNGSGYNLKAVYDNVEPGTGTANIIYVANGGTPIGTAQDVEGYLVINQGNQVSAIGKEAFKDVTNALNIILPEHVQFIADYAFYHCYNITAVNIDNVSFIGNHAFQNCSSLSTVVMGTGVHNLGVEAFENCTKLTNITFSPSTQSIGDGAFANCSSLQTLNLNNLDDSIGADIGAAAFYNCSALSTVNMADSTVKRIGDSAFATVMGDTLKEFVFPAMRSDVANCLGNRLFSGRAMLETVVFPSNYGRTTAVVIPESMFHGCGRLKYVEFPTQKGSDPYACSAARYATGDPKKTSSELFADVANKDFYVSGPATRESGVTAYPRESTWSATTRAYEEPGYVPYLYYENGVEYYEICSGDYLLCIRKNPDGTGTLTSCTRKDPTLTPSEGTLTIPDKVGDTLVVAIDTDCFSDTGLTETVRKLVINDNIKEIADSTFANTNGKWKKLQEVTIGSSVEKLGANAFLDCTSLTDITFKTPVNNDYTKLQFPDSALQTKGNSVYGLTIHGDIVEGYRPFEYAMNSETYAISKEDGRRVCYQSRWDSPSSKHMTVMYGESSYSSTGLVTLLDYPKYSELEDTTGATGAELAAHNREREQQFYENYAVETYDDKRIAFVNEWLKATSPEDVYGGAEEDTGDPLYGPWISEEFVNNWSAWVERARPSSSVDSGDASGVFDWLFKPITAYALGETVKPDAYFDHEGNQFNFMTNYKKCRGIESQIPTFPSTGATINYLGWNDFEKEIIRSVEDIVIPEGVESIDVYDYYNLNGRSFSTYLSGKSEYTSELDEDKKLTVVPGLFSGLIKDYEGDDEGNDKKMYEARGVKGNDRIRSVTMSSVLYLPDYAFDNCERLVSVTLGDAMQQVGALPFRDCNRLVDLTGNAKYPAENGILYETQNGEAEAYKIVECLLARGTGSPLSDMTVSDLTDSKIPFVSAIAKDAFADCDSINTINLYPATLLTEILDGTFRDCDNLALVTLPASVNDIQDNAFADICKDSTLTPRCQIYIYGKEVSISDNAFGKDADLADDDKRHHAKERIKIWAYDNTAAARYAKYYAKCDDGKLHPESPDTLMMFEAIPASESAFSVIFMDYDGTQIGNTQFVINDRATKPDTTELEKPDHRPGYRFSGWLGTNGQDVDETITDNCIFFAQYESDGTMVNGQYVLEFRDGIDGRQLNNMYANREDGKYYIDPGTSFMSNDWEVPPYYAHEGYKFLAWSNNWTENTVIEENMTIIALYEADNSGGSGGSSGVVGGSSGTTQTPGTTSNKNSSNTSSSTSSSSTSTGSTTSGSSEVGKYTVTVENGSGSGSYDVGSTVIIAANTAPAGMVFKNWTTESNGVALASVSMTATTFTMPANNVTVTANYVTATPTAANTGSTGSVGNTGNTGNTGNRDNGSTRVDITKPGISNKDLATANTNGSTDNFVVKITETDEATRAVADALTNKYGSLENILYYAMDISLYDSTGTVKISDTSGLSVDITIPIPDALVAYGGNNKAGAVINGNQLENLNENFTTINGVPCIRFTATHFSPYTIYVDTGNLTEGMLDVTPKTGDPIHPKWFLSIGLACMSVILFMKKDKAVKVKTA